MLDEISNLLSEHYKEKVEQVGLGKDRLTIDFNKISHYNLDLAQSLEEDPETWLEAAKDALLDFSAAENADRNVVIRIKNLPKTFEVRVRDVRSKNLSKLITVQGQIRSVSDVNTVIVSANFECPSCGETTKALQLSQKIKAPKMCKCGRKGSMRELGKEYADTQRLVVEETTEKLKGNEQPRKINIILTHGLTNPDIDRHNTPGNRVLVNGILKERGKGKEDSTEREFVLMANHIEALETDYEEIEISKEEEQQIKNESKKENVLDLMVQSYAPEIIGHDTIKKAIILQLFGGNTLYEGQEIKRRGNINILVVGDPGASKTKLVKFASLISPKSRYSSGTGSSGAGLTASVSKDDFIGGWILEAGVMVLAHKGVAILDELDKIDSDERGKLHEALSENEVNINKASIHTVLRCEAACLAAANPKHGRFSLLDPIAPQIALEAPLMSRFDFIYVVIDEPDEEKDSEVARSMLKLHREDKESFQPPFSADFFKKYISHAKRLPNPKMTKAAEDRIVEIYKDLRNMGKRGKDHHVSVTARYAEALIRESQAAARARLSKFVNESDVEIAKDVILFSLKQLAWDEETGTLDISMIEMGEKSSTIHKAQSIIRFIRKSIEEGADVVSAESVLKFSEEELGYDEEKAMQIVDKLKSAGDIFEPRNGYYKTVG